MEGSSLSIRIDSEKRSTALGRPSTNNHFSENNHAHATTGGSIGARSSRHSQADRSHAVESQDRFTLARRSGRHDFGMRCCRGAC